MNKPLAKSLHTVTVLVRVARLHQTQARPMGNGPNGNAYAVGQAIETLGLADMPDVHGLAAQAIKQLNKFS